MWVVECVTRASGLAVLWKHSVDIIVDSASQNHIDVIINKGKEETWRFTGIYGFPETIRKAET